MGFHSLLLPDIDTALSLFLHFCSQFRCRCCQSHCWSPSCSSSSCSFMITTATSHLYGSPLASLLLESLQRHECVESFSTWKHLQQCMKHPALQKTSSCTSWMLSALSPTTATFPELSTCHLWLLMPWTWRLLATAWLDSFCKGYSPMGMHGCIFRNRVLLWCCSRPDCPLNSRWEAGYLCRALTRNIGKLVHRWVSERRAIFGVVGKSRSLHNYLMNGRKVLVLCWILETLSTSIGVKEASWKWAFHSEAFPTTTKWKKKKKKKLKSHAGLM